MIKRLYVDNYKCLVNFEIAPAQVACLVGPNGGGKSAVFGALQGLQGFLAGQLAADAFPTWTRTRWDRRASQRFELDLRGFEGTLFHYELVVRHDESSRRAVVEREAVSTNGALLYEHTGEEIRLFVDEPTATPRMVFPGDPRRSFLPLLQASPENKLLTAFKEWNARMWLFALRPSEISPDSTVESDMLSTDGKNFVSWYRTILQETPAAASQIWQDLRPIVPGLQAIKLQKLGVDARLLLLDCEIAGRPFSLALGELSDGQRILLLHYAILHALAPAASLIVFDEPDNFVAEEEIQPWLSQMRDAIVDAKRGTLIAISHHHRVIDYLAADQAWELRRAEEGPTRLQNIRVPRDTGMTASEFLRLGVSHVE
jgi:predicted ATPase